ncbi:MAG: 50S ribosomal protein L35 [bacterium]|nr:50S ribosomal protein L35 [bacterium]
MKHKSRSTAKKRVRITGTGKIKMMKAGRNHLLLQKSKKQKGLGGVGKVMLVSPTNVGRIKKSLPYLRAA